MTAVRKGRLAVALLVAAAPAPVRPAFADAHAPHPAQIDRNGTLILIRSTMMALQNADETGNYTVLRDLGAPSFQQNNTAARLGEIFANLRAQKVDLSGTSVLEPQLTLLPQIETNDLLHIAGFFPSVPTQVNFELLFAPVASRWKLFGLSVNLGSASPVAPAPAQGSVSAETKAKASPAAGRRKHPLAEPMPAAAGPEPPRGP